MNLLIAVCCFIVFGSSFMLIRSLAKSRQIEREKAQAEYNRIQAEYTKSHQPKPKPKRTPTQKEGNCKNCGANSFYDNACAFCGTYYFEHIQVKSPFQSSGVPYYTTSGTVYYNTSGSTRYK